ncbi:MAG TPA: adenylate/guanylate cyclase domain-containing protein [Deltaproteobacteria bacterium]|nr:adenylate/guanylate cyclase domain-containing protein [Deltaproteobacteria bacterium]
MLQKRITRAVLFADISSSAVVYESFNSVDALNLVSSCISVMSGIVSDHCGTIINTIGEEVMCTFPSAEQAIEAAIAIQKSHEAFRIDLPDKRVTLSIRIGIHWGEVIKQSYDVFGDAVSVAARVIGLAKPGQVFTTSQTINALPNGSGLNARCIDRAMVNGKGGESSIFEVIWDDDLQTMSISSEETMQVIYCRLHLRQGERELYVDSGRPFVTLGRQVGNDLVVGDVIASRMHGRIEVRRGKFVLIDQSTNGTYVSQEGKSPVFVHNDEIILSAHGIISLGREADPDSRDAIYFTYEYH